MGRGRSKQKVQQAFLQRKWPLGGYRTLWEKRGDAHDSLQGRLAATDGPRASWDYDCGACCELDLAAGFGQKPSGGTTPVPSITEWNWPTGKSVSVSSFPEGQRISTRSILAACSTRNVNEVRSATNNCRRWWTSSLCAIPLANTLTLMPIAGWLFFVPGEAG